LGTREISFSWDVVNLDDSIFNIEAQVVETRKKE